MLVYIAQCCRWASLRFIYVVTPVLLCFDALPGKELPYEELARDSDEDIGANNTRPLLQDDNNYTAAASDSSRDYVVAEVRKNRNSTSSSVSASKVARASTTGSAGVEFASDLEAHPVVSPLSSRVAATPLLTSEAARSPSRERSQDHRSVSKEEWQVFPDDMFAVPTAAQYTRAELVERTPWKQFFTHPVARALLVAAFCYVRSRAIFLFHLSDSANKVIAHMDHTML